MSLTISGDHLCDQCKDVTPMITLSTCVATATKITPVSAGSATAGQVSSLGHYQHCTQGESRDVAITKPRV